MPKTDADSALGLYQAEGHAIRIEYSRQAMETVRTAVNDGFYTLSRGGLEVGGVLFGRHTAGTLRILEARPLACEHASGPAFVLSTKDEAGLQQLLASRSSLINV